MGLFDFVADAGSKIFGSDDEKEATVPLGVHLRDNGIDTSNIKISYAPGKVTLGGSVPTQVMREQAVLVAGNVKGIGQVDDQLQVAAPDAVASAQTGGAGGSGSTGAAPTQDGGSETDEGWSRTYTVQPGDTLGKIAQEMYGKASRYTVIFEANRPMLSDPNKIYPGQVLRIPNLED